MNRKIGDPFEQKTLLQGKPVSEAHIGHWRTEESYF